MQHTSVNRIILLSMITLMAFGCTSTHPASTVPTPSHLAATSQPQPVQSQANVLEPAQNSNDPYRDIIDVGTADQQTIPGKYQCGKYTVTPPISDEPDDNRIVNPPAVFLEPIHKLLITDLDNSQESYSYDVTFTSTCQQLYYVDFEDAGATSIHVVDLRSGARSVVTIPNSALPRTYQHVKHTLVFLYDIDS